MNKRILNTFLAFLIILTVLTSNNLFIEGISRVNMGYLYFGNPKDYSSIIKNTNNSINVVSPSYFDLDENGMLKITSKLEVSFVQQMQKEGKKVVPFLSNHWDRSAGQKALNNKERLVDDIVNAIKKYNLDGINVDIENLSHTDRDNHTAFIKLLREKLPKEKQVSVAVAANPNNLKIGWHGSYDYKNIARYSDYLMLMSYDESWDGSPAGPIASIGFVEKSIQHLFSQGISKDKIVLGIPFYGRIWKSDGMFKGRGVSNIQIDNLIKQYNGKVVFDIKSQSPKAIITIPKGEKITVGYNTTLNEGTYTIWFENEQSIKEKLKLVQKYDLKGTGSWSIGQESKNTWDYFNLWLNGKYFLDTQNHWAEQFVFSMINKGWMVGTSSTQFSPDKSLTRAEAATVIVRALDLKLEAENKATSYSDVPNSHWGKEYIDIISYHGLMTGVSNKVFQPDMPLTREQMATIITRIVEKEEHNNIRELSASPQYKDVNPQLWSYRYIIFASEQGLFGGYDDGTFKPAKQITRAEMATLMDRLSSKLNIE